MSQPNILLIFTDQMRYDAVEDGVTGKNIHTGISPMIQILTCSSRILRAAFPEFPVMRQISIPENIEAVGSSRRINHSI